MICKHWACKSAWKQLLRPGSGRPLARLLASTVRAGAELGRAQVSLSPQTQPSSCHSNFYLWCQDTRGHGWGQRLPPCTQSRDTHPRLGRGPGSPCGGGWSCPLRKSVCGRSAANSSLRTQTPADQKGCPEGSPADHTTGLDGSHWLRSERGRKEEGQAAVG